MIAVVALEVVILNASQISVKTKQLLNIVQTNLRYPIGPALGVHVASPMLQDASMQSQGLNACSQQHVDSLGDTLLDLVLQIDKVQVKRATEFIVQMNHRASAYSRINASIG